MGWGGQAKSAGRTKKVPICYLPAQGSKPGQLIRMIDSITDSNNFMETLYLYAQNLQLRQKKKDEVAKCAVLSRY